MASSAHDLIANRGAGVPLWPFIGPISPTSPIRPITAPAKEQA